MMKRVSLLFLAAFLILGLTSPSSARREKMYKIGVQASRGKEACMKRWKHTAYYLSDLLEGASFQIVPLGYEEIHNAVSGKRIDFLLANPIIYVTEEIKSDIEKICTVKHLVKGKYLRHYGAVIITSKDKTDIHTLEDFEGKVFIAADENSLGGWRATHREFFYYGMDPYKDLGSLSFSRTEDAVVTAVKEGMADGGTLRTYVFEAMAVEGKIDPGDFNVIHNTRLYPDWPLAKLKDVDEELAERMTMVLLSMESDNMAAVVGDYGGWTVPRSYQDVHDCMRELRIGPYSETAGISLAEVIKRYWYFIVGALVVITTLSLILWHFVSLNTALRTSQELLTKEVDVRKKTEEELRQMQEHLVQDEKLKAIGRIASGVAHEVRNPLAIVLQSTNFLERWYAAQNVGAEDAKEVLRIQKDNITRAASIIHALSDFSKASTISCSLVQMNTLLEQSLTLVTHNVVAGDVEVIKEMDRQLPNIMADKIKLEQVFVNVMLNSFQAMKGREGEKKLYIRTRSEVLERVPAMAFISDTDGLKPGDKVVTVEIEDTGGGISKEDITKVFEPFFTTKGPGGGTGLGLAISKNIVEMHKGLMKVESEEDKGTKVTVQIKIAAPQTVGGDYGL